MSYILSVKWLSGSSEVGDIKYPKNRFKSPHFTVPYRQARQVEVHIYEHIYDIIGHK